jgi:hypothetical protein
MTSARKTETQDTNRQIDLSPAAILQRLEEVGQLYELGIYLAQAKPVASPEGDKQDQNIYSTGR